MGIDTVSSRYDGEVPNDDDLNELLEELKTILVNNGVPSSMIQWPMVADGPLDMNNNAILNVSDVSGEIRVNAANSLASAIGNLPASGGTIIIDSGYQASTTAAGLTLTTDNVTIKSSGGGSIYIEDRASAGPGLTVTGDNFSLENVDITSGALATTTVGVSVFNASDYTITGCTFNGLPVTALSIGALTLTGVPGIIYGNSFTSCTDIALEIGSANGTSISGNTFVSSSGTAINFEYNAGEPIKNITVSSNVVEGHDAAIASNIATASTDHFNLTMSGNSFGVGCTCDLSAFKFSVTTGNTIGGNVELGNSTTVFSDNRVNGTINVDDAEYLVLADNTISSTITFANTPVQLRIEGNYIGSGIDFGAVLVDEVATFIGNTCGFNVVDLLSSEVGSYDNNTVFGSIT